MKNGIKNGQYKKYYQSGNIEHDYTYKNDQLDGKIKEYHGIGTLSINSNYINGKLNGIKREYYDNGSLKMEIAFDKGKAIKGISYMKYGIKKELTHANFNNMGLKY